MMKFFLILSIIFSSVLAFAQQEVRHPRVIELEDKISDEASLYFSRRFPGQPFVAKVNIVPLRSKSGDGEKTERLPYFEYESDNDIDEWDDLSIPISFLRNRVTKITLDVLVPNDFDETKIESMKQDLVVYLRLVPLRDEIKIEKKLAVDKPELPYHYYYMMGALIVSAILIGAMIKWSATTIKPGKDASAAGPAPVAMASTPMASAPREGGKRKNDPISLNEVMVNDSLKLWEQAQGRIKIIQESASFPTLNDMLLLESLGEKRTSKLGALIFELPVDVQKRLLKLSKGEMWLESFSNPGKLDSDCLDTLERMVRTRALAADSASMEELLIQIWRMGNSAEAFLKRVEQDHAFYILDHLPKSISLPLARSVFPGGWGRLLERRQLNIVPQEEKIHEYLTAAKSMMPFYDDNIVEQYRKDREILSYLDSVTVEDEKQIYDVLNSDSFVKKIRKPFYPIFSLPSEKLTSLVAKFPLDVWAIVSINSPRNYIKAVQDTLDDKKKLLFSTHLKRLDVENPSVADVAYWRSQIITMATSLYPEDFLQIPPISREAETPNEAKESA